MTKSDAIEAVRRTEPTAKAARLREVMPEIERRLAAGVQLGTIHKALTDTGFELTFQTLKTYLYRYRKKHQAKTGAQQAKPVSPWFVGKPASSQLDESDSYETDSPGTPLSRGPISTLELCGLLKSDPAEQAEEMAYYERLAKQNRRNKR